MPYITTESVAAKRKQLRAQYPQYKMSVTRRHGSSISVAILEGPIQLLNEQNIDRGYQQVNPYYINSNHSDEVATILNGIKSIISAEQTELTYDGDYGSVPTYYTNISIGSWDKSYQVK